MKKIYIAGPDVFEKNSKEIGKKLVALCKKYGYIGLYPLDNEADFDQEKHKIASDIFIANVKMINEADIVIANLNSFRGKEADSGTIWECGYAYGLGKRVYGYMKESCSYVDQFSENEKVQEGEFFFDNEGRFIEDFDHPINLMIACSVEQVVSGDFEDVLKVLRV
ncbi:nucleoside 2-deoxyribosyltransferase [Sulfurimonas aquatica]|uniref:Nucleoside 2-deoxyribosyltransferase n=1 Tax=Sulfurimonas aquatica TaxID=2672570 RepID=A0A975GCV1_9BACT|nr:nucleoside 2-deoxyribosyltransferase [Sulfurimonas aquatica]QSZ42005.1 nucleoside 2-deoxyribosyltransferase [Sulfurimonas aquatica]